MLRPVLELGKALGDEARLRALALLGSGDLCLCHLIAVLALAPSTVSRHMDLLVRSGLVERTKKGKWVYFRLAGRDAPADVRKALEWALEGARSDPRAAEDGERLARVRCCSPEELTACYRSGN